MLEYLRQLWAGIISAWQRLSTSARVNIGLASLATVGIIALLVILSGRHEYIELYSGLDPKEVDDIQAALAEQGIPYRMSDGYTTVRVPASEVGRARVVLSQRDLPTAYGTRPGFELLGQESVWTSPEKHAMNVRIAILSELQRMLNEMDFIERAYVYIHPGEEELFARDRKPSEASALLKVRRAPTRQEIRAVLGIISAHGGVDLDENHITVATTDGDILHSPTGDDFTRLASTKHELIRELEHQRERKIQDALRAAGINAIVEVSAKLDFSRRTITEEQVTEGADLSTAELSTTLTTTESLPEGPPGAFSNLPEGVPGPTQTETRETTEETITNTEPSRTRTETIIEPGDVQEYAVSAIIDWVRTPTLDASGEPTGEETYGPPTAEKLAELRQFIAKAVGTDVAVEDVHVISQPLQMDRLTGADTLQMLQQRDRVSEVTKWGGWVLKFGLVAAFFLLAWRLLKRLVAVPEEATEVEGHVEVGASPEEIRRREIQESVETLAQQQPDAVASLLRAWMTETRE